MIEIYIGEYRVRADTGKTFYGVLKGDDSIGGITLLPLMGIDVANAPTVRLEAFWIGTVYGSTEPVPGVPLYQSKTCNTPHEAFEFVVEHSAPVPEDK